MNNLVFILNMLMHFVLQEFCRVLLQSPASFIPLSQEIEDGDKWLKMVELTKILVIRQDLVSTNNSQYQYYPYYYTHNKSIAKFSSYQWPTSKV